MTTMEQSLCYIEREIRFMVKDQFGNPAYAKYADRVIEDACGIPHFCSTVLSSKRPLTAILRAVRGPRGDVIIRFFNASLHDARIEMVMVLAEAIKLRTHNNKASIDAHKYFMKLYKKAIKRTVKLVTGSNHKESYKSMYHALRHYAKMDDFDEDDDEEDDLDLFNEFGDSDFAESCLNAYRDGKSITEPAVSVADYRHPYKLPGNEDMLKEIAAIEQQLGRHLTDAELDKILCGDEDDEVESFVTDSKDQDRILDNLADAVYKRLLQRLDSDRSEKYESLEDFLNNQNTTAVEDSSSEVTKTTTNVHPGQGNPMSMMVSPLFSKIGDIPKDPSLEKLVGLHNILKNSPPEPVGESTHVVSSDSDSGNSEDSSEDDSSNLPPDDESGGITYDNPSYNDVTVDTLGFEIDPLTYSPAEIDAKIAPTLSDYGVDELTLDGPSIQCISNDASNAKCPPNMEHSLIVSDVINDAHHIMNELNQKVKNRIANYFTHLNTVNLTDVFVSVSPSSKSNVILNLSITIRVTGDYEIINLSHLDVVASMHGKEIAKVLDIPEDKINVEVRVVESIRKFDEDFALVNSITGAKGFSSSTTSAVYSMLSAIAIYIYRRLAENAEDVNIRFIDDIESVSTMIYFSSKSNNSLGVAFTDFYNSELINEGILNEIANRFSIAAPIYIYRPDSDDVDTDFHGQLMIILKNNIDRIVESFAIASSSEITHIIDSNNLTAPIASSTNLAFTPGNIAVDLVYTIRTNSKLDDTSQINIEERLVTFGPYATDVEDTLRAISSSIEVSPYLTFIGDVSDDDNDNIKTNNFGI